MAPLWVMSFALLVAFSLWGGEYNEHENLRYLELEANTLTWVVGSVLFFLLVAILPTALGTFQGFDDAHTLPETTRLPPRTLTVAEIYALHGLLNDVST